MEIRVKFTCVEGSVRVFKSRDDPAPAVLQAGEEIVAEVAEVVGLPETASSAEVQRYLKANAAHAWNMVGAGRDGRAEGVVTCESLDIPLVIREYREINHFLNPDAEDHRDYLVKPGKKVKAKTIGSNVITLMPTGVSFKVTPA